MRRMDQQNERWCHSLEKVCLWEKIGLDLNFGCEVTEDVLQTFGHIGLKIRRVVWDGKPSLSIQGGIHAFFPTFAQHLLRRYYVLDVGVYQ